MLDVVKARSLFKTLDLLAKSFKGLRGMVGSLEDVVTRPIENILNDTRRNPDQIAESLCQIKHQLVGGLRSRRERRFGAVALRDRLLLLPVGQNACRRRRHREHKQCGRRADRQPQGAALLSHLLRKQILFWNARWLMLLSGNMRKSRP
jgi:hypothetical protein